MAQRFARFIPLLALLCAACGSEDAAPDETPDPEGPEGPDIPAAPEGGEQLVGPRFTIPAGEEVFMCMRVGTVDRDLYVQSSTIFQAEGGHHVIAFHSGPRPELDPEPHVCDGAEMAGDARFVTAGTSKGVGMELPPGIATFVPAGAEIWTQSHYLNTSTEATVVQDVVNFELIDETELEMLASTFAHIDLGFELMPQQETKRELECVIDRSMRVPWLLPHMHETGKEYEILVRRGEEVLAHKTGSWSPELRDELPFLQLEEELSLEPGDTIKTTCIWENDKVSPLQFPNEMCVTFFPFYPGNGELLVCNETGSLFSLGETE